MATYFEREGNRLDSFNKAIKHIARVVRSEESRPIAVSTTSTASASVTCSRQEKWLWQLQEWRDNNYRCYVQRPTQSYSQQILLEFHPTTEPMTKKGPLCKLTAHDRVLWTSWDMGGCPFKKENLRVKLLQPLRISMKYPGEIIYSINVKKGKKLEKNECMMKKEKKTDSS